MYIKLPMVHVGNLNEMKVWNQDKGREKFISSNKNSSPMSGSIIHQQRKKKLRDFCGPKNKTEVSKH